MSKIWNNKIANLEEKSITKDFFNIWIIKEIINSIWLKSYYKTFLDENGFFSDKKVEFVLKKLYEFISSYDVTTYRPNNINILKDEIINYILSKQIDEYNSWLCLDEDIFLQIPWADKLSFIYDNSFNKDKEKNIEIVKKWLIWFLNKLEIHWFLINDLTDEIAKEVIKILKNKS